MTNGNQKEEKNTPSQDVPVLPAVQEKEGEPEVHGVLHEQGQDILEVLNPINGY